MFQKIELRKTRDFSTKINMTFEFLRQNFKTLGKCLIFISGPFVLLQGLFNGLYQKQVLSLATPSSNPFGFVADAILWLGLTFLFVIIGYVTSLIVVNEFVRRYEIMEDPSEINVEEIWEGVKGKYLRILFASIAGSILILVGTIFLIIPGIYIGVTLSLLGPIMIIENKSFGEAFSRCFSLINEKWWSTFGLIMVTSIVAGFMAVVFAIPQYIFTFLFTFQKLSNSHQPELWQQTGLVISTMIYSFGANLLQSIVFVAIIFQFYNLVERKEARGLMNKVESFGKIQTGPDRPDETY